jgi:hypothetical protein
MQAVYSDDEIKQAFEVDTQMIVTAFGVSIEVGKASIKMAISGFIELLKKQKGSFVPSMDLDFRRYIVGLLDSTINAVDNVHKECVAKEIILPN